MRLLDCWAALKQSTLALGASMYGGYKMGDPPRCSTFNVLRIALHNPVLCHTKGAQASHQSPFLLTTLLMTLACSLHAPHMFKRAATSWVFCAMRNG